MTGPEGGITTAPVRRRPYTRRMRHAPLLIICLVLGACGMKGNLYEPAPEPAETPAPAASPEATPGAGPEAAPAPVSDPRGARKAIPATPSPDTSR